MKYTCLLAMMIALGAISVSACAQSTEDSVKAAVGALFTGMKDADPGEIRQAFADSAILQSTGIDKDGKTAVITTSIDRFVTIISTLGKGGADERVDIDWLRIDGPLALVWAPYSFYLKGSYHHCGVDTFQLIRTAKGWKIQYILYTGRKDACPLGAPGAP
jgi:hypothetical protein